ncbi:MAG: hypothetical protein GY750_12500 [Lentisphaerae bacterium]|nr:hypothetical protein [Lentisphaerota bacterium]MCP4102232.1 hypothetical protein [Lentisphaerota bacterium]
MLCEDSCFNKMYGLKVSDYPDMRGKNCQFLPWENDAVMCLKLHGVSQWFFTSMFSGCSFYYLNDTRTGNNYVFHTNYYSLDEFDLVKPRREKAEIDRAALIDFMKRSGITSESANIIGFTPEGSMEQLSRVIDAAYQAKYAKPYLFGGRTLIKDSEKHQMIERSGGSAKK